MPRCRTNVRHGPEYGSLGKPPVAPTIARMAWEWVALVATAAVGVVGIAFTWLSGKQGRDHAERLARIGNEHAAAMAREERTQQRLADTYVALLEMAERVGQWAQAVRPMMDTSPAQPVPPLPDLAEQATVEARVGAFGSIPVRERLDVWRSIVHDIIGKDFLIRLQEADAEHARPAVNVGQPRLEIHNARPKEREAREALAHQIAVELGHRPDAVVTPGDSIQLPEPTSPGDTIQLPEPTSPGDTIQLPESTPTPPKPNVRPEDLVTHVTRCPPRKSLRP
jgi:hypothetical protein